jgi:hypothetical protein
VTLLYYRVFITLDLNHVIAAYSKDSLMVRKVITLAYFFKLVSEKSAAVDAPCAILNGFE